MKILPGFVFFFFFTFFSPHILFKYFTVEVDEYFSVHKIKILTYINNPDLFHYKGVLRGAFYILQPFSEGEYLRLQMADNL